VAGRERRDQSVGTPWAKERDVSPDWQSSYELVPYESRPFAEAHPNAMATMAGLFGMEPPDVRVARVLEIGCASGGNLIPMAQELPKARFLGIDPSERQVAEGRATIEAVGLENIELRQASVMDLGPDVGVFDYIICHGVFSWVAPQLQRRILALCGTNLARNGLAYVSYNVYPGWHLRGILRDAMFFHIGGEADPREAIRRARELIDFLVHFASEPNGSYATMLREVREVIVQGGDSCLFHDFLEEVNDPFYYHQFVEKAAAAGLKVVGDAEPSKMPGLAPDLFRKALGRMSDDPARQEQYVDFLCGRTFRRTVLCQEGVELLPAPSADMVEQLQPALYLHPGSLSPDLRACAAESFVNWRGQTVTIDHPIVKAAALVLAERYPRALPFDDLWPEVLSRVSRAGLEVSDRGEPQRRRLAEFLLQGYGLGWIELHSHLAPFVQEPGPRPATTPLARHKARAGGKVPNLRHELFDPSRFERHLLQLLDGHRTESALVDALDALVTEGRLTLRTSGSGPLDPATRRTILAENLHLALRHLAGKALLVA
jgi:methyltransferase-like protein/SAM-dependent methyltransferase